MNSAAGVKRADKQFPEFFIPYHGYTYSQFSIWK